MPKQERKPTEKQKRFVKEKAKDPSISDQQAALNAGYSKATAKNAGKNIVEKRGVEAFLDMLVKDEEVAEALNEGITANRTISIVSGKDATGSDTNFVDVPDYKIRLDYLKEILGLKGYKAEKVPGRDEVHATNVTIFNVNPEDAKTFNENFNKFAAEEEQRKAACDDATNKQREGSD